MFGSMAATEAMPVYVEKKSIPSRTLTLSASGLLTAFWLIVILPTFILEGTACAAVNVSFSTAAPANIQNDVIANLTNYFDASVTVTPFFPNNRNIIVSRKNANSQGTDPKLVTLDTLATKVVAISTLTFIDAYALGMQYERSDNATFIGSQLSACQLPEHFGLVKIDSTTCENVLLYADSWLIQKDSGVVVVPNIIQ